MCRDVARWRARLLAAVVRSNATSAFTAERQVVGQTREMLDTVDQIESSARQRPADGRTGQVAAALRALALATSDAAAQDAYHRVLFAVGNDHRGSYFPIVLDAVPFLAEILVGGTSRARERTLDVLIDLVGSFGPDPDVVMQDGVRPEDLPAMLRASVEDLRPTLQILVADSSAPEVQRLAGELLDCLAEGAAQPGVAPDGASPRR
jgi:hypothetical protein